MLSLVLLVVVNKAECRSDSGRAIGWRSERGATYLGPEDRPQREAGEGITSSSRVSLSLVALCLRAELEITNEYRIVFALVYLCVYVFLSFFP